MESFDVQKWPGLCSKEKHPFWEQEWMQSESTAAGRSDPPEIGMAKAVTRTNSCARLASE
ncbi:MAG: hypothetical protein COA41_10110 [Sphingopyxis sp.]|nr:MAG: hypothetical protein COA41_10110 [Sphingopyxis sp.]